MLGARMKLGEASKLQCSGVVLECLAINIGFSAKDLESLGLDLGDELHCRDHVAQRLDKATES